jgi:hypothetical protein
MSNETFAPRFSAVIFSPRKVRKHTGFPERTRLPERNRPTGAGFSFTFATSMRDEKTSQVVCFSTEIALEQ